MIKLSRLGYYRAPSDRNPQPFHISNGELVEVITGGMVEFDNGRGPEYFGRGTIFRHIAGEHTVCKSHPDNPYRCLSLKFRLHESVRRYPRVTQWYSLKNLDDFVSEVLSCYHNPRYDNSVLGAYIYATLNWHGEHNRSVQLEDDCPDVITKAIKYIDTNLGTVLTIGELARKTGLSKPYFQSMFKKYVGKTPHSYHLERRLQKAREMLASTNRPIKSVSNDCGFENIESFYRAFKKLCGITPAVFRRNHSPDNWSF